MNASERSAFQAARTGVVTGWFRNPTVWTTLDQDILPSFPTPRIWTGACGSGEEAYTAAIVALPHGGSILATDINLTMIDVAVTAKYQSRAVLINATGIGARIASSVLEQALMFNADTGEAEPRQEIRGIVEFGVLDLNFDTPPACDVAILANVWRHLDPAAAVRLLSQLQRQLPPQGRLVIGVADTTSDNAEFLAALSEHFVEAEHELIWRPL